MHSPLHQGPPPLGRLLHMQYRDFYPLRAESVAHARQDFRAAAHRAALYDSVAESAELCLSELASNAVRHAKDKRDRRWFHVSCHVGGTRRHHYLRIGVHDIDGAHIPTIPPVSLDPLAAFDEEAESGRGLFLVAQLSDEIGVEHGEGCNGKTVWCRWRLSPRAAPPRSARLCPAGPLPSPL